MSKRSAVCCNDKTNTSTSSTIDDVDPAQESSLSPLSSEPPTKTLKQHHENVIDNLTCTTTTSSKCNNNQTRNDTQQQQQQQQLQLESIHRLFDWLTKLGADLSRINISPSPLGGLGAFASTNIPPGGLIGTIPNVAVMSVNRSKNSVVGKAVANTIFEESNDRHEHDEKFIATTRTTATAPPEKSSRPTEEFVLWLDMCHGRYDSNHPHHLYLASLPSKAPDVPSWSEEERLGLEGTNLGDSAKKVSMEFQKNQYEKWMPQLKKAHPEIFGSDCYKEPDNNNNIHNSSNNDQNNNYNINTKCNNNFTFEDLIWARGMYYSRRFPSVLLQEEQGPENGSNNCSVNDNTTKKNVLDIKKDEKNLRDLGHDKYNNNTDSNFGGVGGESSTHIQSQNVGIMLPVFDLLNHALHQQITWSGSPTHVSFEAGPNGEGIPKDAEIYNNYGPKGNDMLMMTYGFALAENIHDSYGLQLVMMVQSINNDNIDNEGNMNHHDEQKHSETNTSFSSQVGTSDGGGVVFQKKNLGTFQIHRRESPMFPQFPTELWVALNQMFETEQEEEEEPVKQDDDDDKKSSEMANDLAETSGSTSEVEIGVEAVELLLETLQRRVQPFLATKDVDCRCETNVTRYRNGQRLVLEEAIVTLQEMLPEENDETDDEVLAAEVEIEVD